MNCPGCGAFINPAWERCHACGGALKGAAFLETVKPDNPGPATEADFQRETEEAFSRINAVWPEGLAIDALPAYADIQRLEAAANALWIEARHTGRYAELQPRFCSALAAWEAAMLEGVAPDINRKRTGGLKHGEI